MFHLSDIATTGTFIVQHIEERGEESIRLKRLGICEQRRLEVLQAGDPMIVRVVGTRIGLSRQLARCVTVTAATADATLPLTQGVVAVGTA